MGDCIHIKRHRKVWLRRHDEHGWREDHLLFLFNLVEYGHEMLRDILVRFAGIDTSDPDNWSSLVEDRTRNTANNADIDTWKVRWWALEPTDIDKIIQQIMYEFSFIFKYVDQIIVELAGHRSTDKAANGQWYLEKTHRLRQAEG